VRSSTVVVLDVDAEHMLELAPAEDQQPVEAFAADASDLALHVCICVRSPNRRADDLDGLAREEGIEGAREFGVAIVDQEPHRSLVVVEIHDQVARLCSIQAVSGLLVIAKYSIRRLPIEMKTSTYRRRSQTVSTVKKSHARIDSRCDRRKLRHDCASRRGGGGKRARVRMLRTELAETTMPNLRSLPAIGSSPSSSSRGRGGGSVRARRG
jgi:hypothetical protein